MKCWKPEGEDRKYVELVFSMARDTLIGKGVVSREAFAQNLRMLADSMEGIRPTVSEEERRIWNEELDRMGY